MFTRLTTSQTYDLLIVGSGPAGLACAIEAKKHGLSHLLVDKGSVVDSIRRFPVNLTFFSTPDLLEIGGVPFLTSGFRPTRVETVRYYQKVVQVHGLAIASETRVSSIVANNGGFEVVTPNHTYRTRNVVLATGYFDDPSPFDVPGASLQKVKRYYDEPFRYFGRKVAVVGGKNSAVEVALELFRNGAEVTLVHRGSQLSEGVKYWIQPDIENRIKSGEIKSFFETRIKEIKESSVILEGKHSLELSNDVVFVMVGYRPDTRLLEQAGVEIQRESLAPVHDPQTMETNTKGVFIAGSVAAGKYNNKIFIENGRLHGTLIIREILRK